MLINFKNKISGGGGSCDLQEVEQTYTVNGVNEIIPDEGKDGISKATITVNVPDPYLVPLEVTENGSYNPQPDEDGYSSVKVQVQPKLEEKTVEIVKNGTENIIPTAGKDGISKVTVNTNVPIPEPKLEAKNLGDITINGAQSITPSQGFDGISKVDFNVNVAGGAGKISVADTGIKFGFSTFSEVPEIYDFTGITDGLNLFSNCGNLTTIPSMNTSSITNMGYMFNNCGNLTTIPSMNTSSVTNMNYMFYGCSRLTTIPAIDTSSVTDIHSMFSSCPRLTEVHFTGGIKPGCNTSFMFNIITTNGTFFYDLPYNYDPVIKELPKNWKAQPLGDILLKIRVLKDTKWLEGDQNLTLNGTKLTYKGQGLYEVSENITKENYQTKSTELQLDGVKIGDVKWQLEEQGIYTGDNSSVIIEKVGADILTIVPEGGNADGWAYDDTVKGVKSAKIGGDGSTTLKMNIPIDTPFTMAYGQDSEQNYDYAELKNGAGNQIASFKGVKTGPDGQETYSGSTDDGVVQANYHKDSGGDQGLDAFWIKSITWKNLPPYPTV